MVRCNLCEAVCEPRGTYKVLGAYTGEFWQCLKCNYAFLKDPSWLEQAYASAINSVDIGPLNRCIETTRIVKVLIDLYHPGKGVGLDYGGGYGLFTRRMRDLGYRFLWYDTYCENLLAKGFEGRLTGRERYETITAFEVLEHLVNPRTELDQILSSCESFIFSTLLIPEPRPPFDQWWYYGPEHGQHVSFYSKLSLKKIAGRHGKRLITNGSDFHMITSKKVNERWFPWLTKRRVAALLSIVKRPPSLLGADFEAGRQRALAHAKSISENTQK